MSVFISIRPICRRKTWICFKLLAGDTGIQETYPKRKPSRYSALIGYAERYSQVRQSQRWIERLTFGVRFSICATRANCAVYQQCKQIPDACSLESKTIPGKSVTCAQLRQGRQCLPCHFSKKKLIKSSLYIIISF